MMGAGVPVRGCEASLASSLRLQVLQGLPPDCPVLSSACDIVNQLPVATLLYDLGSLHVLAVNPALEHLTGYCRQELLALDLPALIVTPLEQLHARRDRLQCDFYLDAGPCQLRAKNGELIDVERSLSLLRLDHRQVGCKVIFDIRERLRLEAEYRQAQKMEVLGQLSSGVAHDFNNLLTIILGQIDLMYDAPDCPDSLRSRAAMVRDAAGRAADLTRRLLAYSRRQHASPLVQDLIPLVANTAKLAQPLLGSAIQLHLQLPPAPCLARVDGGELAQVILNLVINARDAMPRGGVIDCAVEARSLLQPGPAVGGIVPAGDYIQLTVSDTGAGIAPEMLSRIFEPFFSTKGDKGTGLGLSTVQAIVHRCGGFLRVQSRVGQGTRFEILLPHVLMAASGGS